MKRYASLILLSLVLSGCKCGNETPVGSGDEPGVPSGEPTATGEEEAPTEPTGQEGTAADEVTDPRALALAAEVNQLGEVIIAAGRGEAYDDSWKQTGGGDGIQTTSAETVANLTALGDSIETGLISLEVEAIAVVSPESRIEIKALVVVFPDGRIRVGRSRVAERRRAEGMPGLLEANPTIAGGVAWIVDVFRTCEIPKLSAEDIADIPGASRLVQREEDWEAVCAGVAAVTTDEWSPGIDDIEVRVSELGTNARLRSDFEMEDGRLTLTRVRYRPSRDRDGERPR